MMPSIDPTSKEPTISRRGMTALSPSVGEKKPARKLDTPVLVAMISATVTLITAILSSPVLLSLVNKADAPAPTSAGELVTSQNSLLANDSPKGESFIAASIPTDSATGIIEFTSTPPDESPASAAPVLEATLAATTLPPQDPDPTASVAASFFQCLAVDVWSAYPASLDPQTSAGCWDLAGWGFSTDQGRLLLNHNPAQDQERGIYIPISGDVDIRFSLQLDEFRTRLNKIGLLNFGIVQNDPLWIYTGGYLSYTQPEPGAASPVRVLISGTNQATQRISTLEAGFQHEVLLSIRDNLMTVLLNGEQTGDPVSLPPGDRVFWIGYVLPSKTELEGMITGFTIQAP
jgi:hypothetical protein